MHSKTADTFCVQGLYSESCVFQEVPNHRMLDYMVVRYHGIENPELAWQMRIFLFHLHLCGWAMALHMRFPHLHRLSNQRSWELTYVQERDAALNTEAHPNKLAVFVIGWVFNLNVAVIGDNLEVWTNCAFNVDTHTQIYVIKVQGGQWVFSFHEKTIQEIERHSLTYPAFFTKKLEEIQAEAQARYLEEQHHWREEGLDVSTEVDPNKAAEHMLRQAQGEEDEPDEPEPDAPEPFLVEGSDAEDEEAAAARSKPSKGKGTGGSKGKGKMSKAAVQAMKKERMKEKGQDSSDLPSEGQAEAGAASTSRGTVRRHTPSEMRALVDRAKDAAESMQQKLSEAAHVQVKAKERKEMVVSGFKAMEQRVKEAEEVQDALLAYVLQMDKLIRAERTLEKSFMTSTRKRKLSSSKAEAEEESHRRHVCAKREVPPTKTKLKKSAAVESEASTPPQPQVTLKCHKCPAMFTAEKALKMHLKEKHSKKKLEHTCPTCGKGFLYKSRLLEHLPKHSQELNFQCDFCEKAFKTQQARGQHMRVAHKEFEYCCPVCQQIFQSHATLKEQQRSSTVRQDLPAMFVGGALGPSMPSLLTSAPSKRRRNNRQKNRSHRRRNNRQKNRSHRKGRSLQCASQTRIQAVTMIHLVLQAAVTPHLSILLMCRSCFSSPRR